MEDALQTFIDSSYPARCQFLDQVIHSCGIEELSYLHGVLDELIRVDFVARMPAIVRDKIFDYLDARSIIGCKLVCRSWNAFVCESAAAFTVLMKGLGVNLSSCANTRNLEVVSKLYNDILKAHLSLSSGVGVGSRKIEGHADRVCALNYSSGLLSSCSYDGTARVANLRNGGSFERLVECSPSASIKTIGSGLISAQFDGKL